MAYKNPEDQRACWMRHYERNKDLYKQRAKVRRDAIRTRNREYVDQIKAGPCTDCGGTFIPFVMQFDHVGDEKNAAVSALVSGMATIEAIDAEIALCELVCANCHGVRTWTRLQAQASN